MKKRLILDALALLVLALALCGCLCLTGCAQTRGAPQDVSASPDTVSVQPAPTPVEAEADDEPAYVQGYAAEEIASPDWVAEFGACDIYDDTFYILADTTDGGMAIAGFDTRTEQFRRYDVDISTLHNPHISFISVNADSAWLYVGEYWTAEERAQGLFTGETNIFLLHMDLNSGEQRISPISFWQEAAQPPMYIIALGADRALIGNHECETKAYLIDNCANVIATPDLVVQGMGVRAWVNGTLYVQTFDGLAELNTQTLELGTPISAIYDQPAVYSSACGHFLTTIDDAFYSVDADTGEKTEIFNWMDVALSLSRLYGKTGLENENGDYFHYTDRITKITRTLRPQKQTLILACLGDADSYGYPREGGGFGLSNKKYICADSVKDAIIRFNNSDPDYKIEVRPYFFDGEEERKRLLIELATGSEVDLLDTSLLPDDAAGASMLVDMLPYLDADEDIGREDFIPGIFADMTNGGGLYEYSDRYNLITMTARDSFAAGGEWTADKIRRILAQYPDLRVQNDAETLSYYFAWAASAEFMDYDNGACSFTDEAFLQWLALLKLLCQTDYDWDSDKYLGEYAIFIDSQFPANVGDVSRRHANGEYVPVGFPDSAGTGSYFMRYEAPTAYGWSFMPNRELASGAVSSVGIMASSDNIDGAWRFIKAYMLGTENVGLVNGIPAQKAAFERAVENELRKEQNTVVPLEEFDETDAEYIRYLAYNTSKCVSNSDVVIDTIRAALNAYIGGVYNAQETSNQLQSRLSIYLAEQYG